MDSRVELVDTIVGELSELVGQYQSSGDFTVFQEALDRWKRRSSAMMATNISSEEAARFDKLRTRGSWESMQPSYDIIVDKHRAFLTALRTDLEAHPQSYTRSKPGSKSSNARPAAASPPLLPPEKVTLAWMFRHVPLKGWSILVGLLLAMFFIGYAAGHSPKIAGVIDELRNGGRGTATPRTGVNKPSGR